MSGTSTKDRLELSAMGAVRPPADLAIGAAGRRERQGFDAVWWADHVLHWFPLSIWTPEHAPQSAAQASPHVWFDPAPVIAAAAAVTGDLRLGLGVTDVVRRHPVSLAQTALTLDHLSGGRFLLGIGTGESLNLEPLGLENRRPMARLEEAVTIIRRLFDSHEPLDFDGDAFTLRGAALGLRPLNDTPPPIWLAAHRPRGLRLVGEMADGWLPLATDPDQYAHMLARVRDAEEAAGRVGAVTAGLYCRVLLADSREQAERMVDDAFLLRFIALTRPAEAFAAHGAEHPLGAGAFGLTSFLPTRYDREQALALAAAVPAEVVRDTVVHGTPDQVAERIGRFVAAGARHVQLTNMTPLASPEQGAHSEALLGEAVKRLRATPLPAAPAPVAAGPR